MSEPTKSLREALAHIRDDWDVVRSERTIAGVHRKRRLRKQRLRLAAGAAGLCGLIAIGWVAWPEAHAPERLAGSLAPASQPTAADPRHLELEDGSQVQLLDTAASLVVDEVTATRVAVRLLAGRARVEVVPRKERTFRVVCGDVTVEVLGTAFELQRDGERTRVSVLHGRVAVHWPSGSSVLAAGEAGWFPKPAVEPSAVLPTATAALPASAGPQARAARPSAQGAARKSAPRSSLQPAAPASWQTRVERGDFKEAYELMVKERVSDDVQELLLAADAARLSGHPAEALPFLRRVIEQHPRDPRASLAAFTLAGVLLNQLERPREAEQAYGRARSLALSPALAQDALARQVEAARRADDVERARELASEYLRRYPNGRRVQWVRELGGL